MHARLPTILGAATPAVRDDAHYRAKLHVDNPNLPLIAALKKAGIEVGMCGQGCTLLKL